MYAFYLHDNYIVKIYYQYEDWQIFVYKDNKKITERWQSTWENDLHGSLFTGVAKALSECSDKKIDVSQFIFL